MLRPGAIIVLAGLTLIASVAAAQNPPSQASLESAGFGVYQKACAVCHDGGDETAPAVDRLQALGRERILRALAAGGVMASRASSLSEAERGQVASFLTATPQRRTQLATAARNAAEAERTQQNFDYPIRRISDPRDRATEVPGAPSWAAPKLGAGPFEFESWEHRNLRAVVVTRGLDTPRAIEFLPNGDILVAERAGKLRIIKNGVLDPNPVAGMPQVAALGTATGFMDIIKHPDFARNGLLYLAYHKPAYGSFGFNVIYRARWNGSALVDGREIFVGDDVDSLYTRMVFGRDGKLYATIGAPGLGTDASINRAQLGQDYAGKILRFNDDGTIPDDNPFLRKLGYHPSIYTLGHRVNLGMTVNPTTGEIWVSEHGPNGGDELNILKAGGNYGWPVVHNGRYYGGEKISESGAREGFISPQIYFLPSIAPGNLIFYTGDKFPAWKGNIIMGAMRIGEAPRTGHLLRIVVNKDGGHVRSEMLMLDLHQRIRDVEQGPDGNIWFTTDEGEDSVLMRLEPGTVPPGSPR